jgi:hypothetical protein
MDSNVKKLGYIIMFFIGVIALHLSAGNKATFYFLSLVLMSMLVFKADTIKSLFA